MDNRIIDGGDLRKYRIEIPNIIDDMGLNVYEFRLYVHMKRVAGQSGACWQSTRTLADACGMSVGKVSESKRSLADKGLIELKRRDTTQGETDYITMVDMWPQNFVRYAGDSSSEQGGVHHTNTPVHTVNGPVHEVKQRSNQSKKEPREEGAPFASYDNGQATKEDVMDSVPLTGDTFLDAAARKYNRQQKGQAVYGKQAKTAEWNLQLPIAKRMPIVEAMADLTWKRPLWEAGDDKIGDELNENAILAFKMGYTTPESIRQLEDEFRKHWSGKDGGSPSQLAKFLGEVKQKNASRSSSKPRTRRVARPDLDRRS